MANKMATGVNNSETKSKLAMKIRFNSDYRLSREDSQLLSMALIFWCVIHPPKIPLPAL